MTDRRHQHHDHVCSLPTMGRHFHFYSNHYSMNREDRARQLYQLDNSSIIRHEPLVCLAPMVRAGTTPLRTLAIEYGADLVYTEELMDRSILNTRRVVNVHGHVASDGSQPMSLNENAVRNQDDDVGLAPSHPPASAETTIDYTRNVANMTRKTIRKIGDHAPLLLRIDPLRERGKLIIQMGTGCPNLARDVALHVMQDADGIDVNMGCPKKFSTGGGMGSALLKDPDRACQIVKSVADAAPTTPVSAKIRLLPNTLATVDFCSGLIQAGCQAIAIHARRVGDADVKPAQWDDLKEVLSILTQKYNHVPFFVNGDFYTRQEFTDFCSQTGARGVLLGRPALYNTSIFRKPEDQKVDAATATYSYNSPLLMDKTTVIQDYLKHSLRYNTHYKNVKYVISEMMSFRRTPPHLVPFLPHIYPGGQTIGKTCDSQSLQELCRLWDVDYQAHIRLGGITLDESVQERQQQSDERSYSDAYILNRLEQTLDGSAVEALPAKRTKVDVA